MRKVSNISLLGNYTVEDGDAGKDHNQILCLQWKEIENDGTIGEIHGKSHFNGEDGA